MNMRNTCLLICSLILLSCQTSPESRHIARGDTVSLDRSITIPELRSHVIFQFAEVIDEIDLKPYETSCIVEHKDLGPMQIQPQQYTVTRVTYNEEMYSDPGAVVRYFNEIYLNSSEQQENLIIICQALGSTMENHSFPVDEIKQATGDYFSF